ncbi:hypothetical protein SELMODRAFT_426257 [Selaginella moellendorffii]|uniref:Sec16 Sec23-binding domain-containing protein n=1 Tax=Selaginella moellendorffii TaxID=88036 RepID=D8SVV1_SELML|nr:hypothetical protein SELMODRAFT_426257 [Selaginella moellendorffii]
MQATAFEVKRLLIAGKQKEALRAAQDGQLWGCALLMARQLGEKFYTDTIADMAQRQFQPGFPLRTLTLLYAGQHAGVFVGNTNSSNVTALQPQPVPASAVDGATQDAVEGMLEEWQENLAIMAANRTNGDERVIMHLGADHCKYPRTYASPEAIQPYKLIYASMLAEAGKINEALRYCQAVLKTLKTVGHAADVCKEAAVALEERLRIHSQGGSTSIVQRFFGNIGLHKMIGPSSPKASDMLILITVPQQLLAEAVQSLATATSLDRVEEGAEAQAPELPLAPPPTANKLVSRVEENGAPVSMSPERPQPTPERPQPVVSGIPPMPPSSNQYAARARQNVRSRYVDTFNKGSVTPSKTSSDSPPLFGVVPKASAKPLAPARFFVPAAAAAAAPDINSNHPVDPSSAPAFVPDTAFSNGNGPFAAAAFAQPVVQDMRNDPGPTPDHLSSGSSPAMFYSNHYPAAPSTVSLPPPPALEVTPPVMVEQQQQNQHQESSIHRHHHQQSGTVGFEAASSSGVFGDELQEVEL